MKKEIRDAAVSTTYSAVLSTLTDAVWARVSKSDVLLLKTNTLDEDGMPLYVTVSVTAKSNKPIGENPAFDPSQAIEDYATHQKEVAEKASAPKKQKETDAESAKRKLERTNMMEQWINTHIADKNAWSATEIQNSLYECYAEAKTLFPTVMIVATVAKSFTTGDSHLINARKEEGKTLYSQA